MTFEEHIANAEAYVTDSGMSYNLPASNDNDNPILALAVFKMLFQVRFKYPAENGDLFSWCSAALNNTRIGPGLWRRSTQHPVTDLNSADNYIAIASLFRYDAQEICELLDKTGLIINTTPDNSLGTIIRAIHQPGNVAFYRFKAGQKPPTFFSLWLCVGLLIPCFQPMSFRNQLLTLRIQSLRQEGDRIPWFVRAFMNLSDYLITKRFGSVWEGIARYGNNPNHPNVLLAKELIACTVQV